MSKLLSLLFTKEWFARDSSKSLSKNKWFAWKNKFFACFWQFVLILRPKSESLLSLFTQSLFFQERQEPFTLVALKSDCEQIAPVALRVICSCCSWKRATGAICSFSLANGFFAHKNRWVNSQPWDFYSIEIIGHSIATVYPQITPSVSLIITV